MENLLVSWEEFLIGKKNRRDVQKFSLHLADNIFSLHEDLVQRTYVHGKYQAFKVNDPKSRDIHKASVRDRLLHHAIYRKLSSEYEKCFIPDSFSCRVDRGMHCALNRFRTFSRKASRNHTKTCWVLKCDIKKCFASIDHNTLLTILDRYIVDKDIVRLLENIVRSFYSGTCGKGLPLGNLTSQLFVNVYLDELDQFVKRTLKHKWYIRYSDDFVILHESKYVLQKSLAELNKFLNSHLKLELHPKKVSIQTLNICLRSGFSGMGAFSRL